MFRASIRPLSFPPMANTVPFSLYQDEYSLENAMHLWQTSGEDGEINYYLDTNGLEDDMAVEMPISAVEYISEALESIENVVGLDFKQSNFNSADWVIGATNDYEGAFTSLEDWGLWSSWFKDPEYAAKWTFTESDEAFLLNEIGYSLGLGLLPESSQNKYSLSDSAMSSGWKGEIDGFTESDMNALKTIWSPFVGEAIETSGTFEPNSGGSNAPTPQPGIPQGGINVGPGGIVIIGDGDNVIDQSTTFVLNTVNINLNNAIYGDSSKGEKVEGTRKDDLIASGDGKDKLIGGGGADQFYFDDAEPFGKKTVDKVMDFDSGEGDTIVVDDGLIDNNTSPEFAVAETKGELKELSKEGHDLVYFEPKGDLFVDGNDDKKGFGGKQVGGLIADLPNQTTLTEEDVLVGV